MIMERKRALNESINCCKATKKKRQKREFEIQFSAAD